MRVKITSKGTPGSLRVVNAETGDELKGVTSVEWCCDADGVQTATIKVAPVPAVLQAEAKIIEVLEPEP